MPTWISMFKGLLVQLILYRELLRGGNEMLPPKHDLRLSCQYTKKLHSVTVARSRDGLVSGITLGRLQPGEGVKPENHAYSVTQNPSSISHQSLVLGGL